MRWVAVAVMENIPTNVDRAVNCLSRAGIQAIVDASVLAWIVVPKEQANKATETLLHARSANSDGSPWFETPGGMQEWSNRHKAAVQEYLTARVYLENGNLKEAEASLGQSITLDSGYADPYWIRAWVHYLQGDIAAALGDYEIVRSCPPQGGVYVGLIQDTLDRIREDR
jgi:hypothetical protein